MFQTLFGIFLDTPHSPIYQNVQPGELNQNRAYYNSNFGYFEWCLTPGKIYKVTRYVGYTKVGTKWRGVYKIGTIYYSSDGNLLN